MQQLSRVGAPVEGLSADKLVLDGVAKRFGQTPAVKDVSLSVQAGEIVCLLGASGCGKTTTLRLAAGVEWPDAGRVLIGGALVAGDGQSVPPERRSVGLMFQDFALFPHLTVLKNVAFGLRHATGAEKRDRARAVLARVRMERYENAYPHELSGGEQQRVALARALAPEPDILLMDEPFSGLDVQLRQAVRDDTVAVLKELGTATLMVTHDPEEALQIADRIALMRDGRVVQFALPGTLWSEPADLGVARFFGPLNVLKTRVEEGAVQTPFGTLDAGGRAGAVAVAVRPADLSLSGGSGQRAADLVVDNARFLGSAYRVEGHLGDAPPGSPAFVARLSLDREPRPGDRIALFCRPNRILIFEDET